MSVKLCFGLVDDRIPVLAPYLHLYLWFAPTFAETACFLLLGVCGLFDDRAVGCLSLGQRKGKTEAKAARLAKGGQVAYNSQ